MKIKLNLYSIIFKYNKIYNNKNIIEKIQRL